MYVQHLENCLYMVNHQQILVINTSLSENLKYDKLLTLINYEWLKYVYLLYSALLSKFKNYSG